MPHYSITGLSNSDLDAIWYGLYLLTDYIHNDPSRKERLGLSDSKIADLMHYVAHRVSDTEDEYHDA